MSWYDLFKDVITAAQKADNIELYKQLLDLQKAMQDMQQENFELKKKNEELTSIIDTSKRIVYSKKRGAVYVINDDGSKEGPYCTHCWETDKLTVSLHNYGSYYHCPHCKAKVQLFTVNDADEKTLLK